MEYGILTLVLVAMDIYAVLQVLGSKASTLAKVLWTLAIIILPVVGLIVWAITGPRSTRSLA